MGENDIINELIEYLQLIIVVGSAARIAYCLIGKGIDHENADMYKKRGKHAVLFLVAAYCLTSIAELFMSYF